MRELIAGMAYIHSLNIAHRDLKSENILMKNTYSPVICDFGLAKQADSGVYKSDNGTPLWKAPEIFIGLRLEF